MSADQSRISPPAARIASTIASTIAGSRPSLKFGTAMSRRAGLMRVEDTGCRTASQAFVHPYTPTPDATDRRTPEAIWDLVVIRHAPQHQVRGRSRSDRAGGAGETQRPRATGGCRDNGLARIHPHLRAGE